MYKYYKVSPRGFQNEYTLVRVDGAPESRRMFADLYLARSSFFATDGAVITEVRPRGGYRVDIREGKVYQLTDQRDPDAYFVPDEWSNESFGKISDEDADYYYQYLERK